MKPFLFVVIAIAMQSASEPRHWINQAVYKRFPSVAGGCLILIGWWLLWRGSGRCRLSWEVGGFLLFVLGLALVGVR